MPASNFWAEPQGAAVFKHAILDRYAPIFASKVGAYSKNHEVGIIDGYAGRGWYEDGSPGSPALMVNTAERLAERRNVLCWFVEEDARTYRELTSGLGALQLAGPKPIPLRGTMSQHLDEILNRAKHMPLFAFIDPFGIGLPFRQLVDDLMGRTSWRNNRRLGPATEVLVNFIHAGIYRNAGMFDIHTGSDVQRKAAAQKVKDLNDNLGGLWWQEIQRASNQPGELAKRIREQYVRRVLDEAGAGWLVSHVAISDRTGQAPIYDLLFFTQHLQGKWFFNDAVSLARQVFQTYSEDESPVLQPSLWEPEDEWQRDIRLNLQRLLQDHRRFRVIDHMEEVYGHHFGLARGVHVKRAAQDLARRGQNVGSCSREPHELELIAPS